ncbi:SAC3 family protein A isoform X2 [Humulus lupulus]|uniref:SAC3 family protein A isoform X2 n=1 Tax=Humulus lupulus TaxID=3486 RepID=UPI002B417912|nr:SAC3 family protein A isoform X2 [Humulus lupulus]
MMNQGGNTEAIAPLDSNSLENRHAYASQGQTSSHLPITAGNEAVPWPAHKVDNSTSNGIPSNSTYHYDQHMQPPVSSSSSLGTVNAPQDYNGYASYANPTDPYGYGSSGFSSYYSGYQQQSNPSYSQPVGAYQNTGAPYQPISSFQNTGSYAGSASYSSTYYNPGDYQTAGGYPSSSYNNLTTSWNDASYANYSSQQYPHYNSGTTSAYSSGTATATATATVGATSVNYQQHYKQWADYYNQSEVPCAPGTENLSVPGASNFGCPVPSVTSSYPTLNSQQLPPPPPGPPPPPPPVMPQGPPPGLPGPPPYASSWRPESSSSEFPPVQSGAVVNGAHDGYWRHGAPASQIHHSSPNQPHLQKPLDQNSSYSSFQDQQKSFYSSGSNSQYSATHQVPPVPSCPQGASLQYATVHQVQPPPQTFQSPSQNVQSLDTRRIGKLQIPTNPRIASNLNLGLLKNDKDSSVAGAAAKPAYINVSIPKPNDSVSSSAGADSLLKMITNARADGTLYTRNWDVEPLFPMPIADAVKQGIVQTLTPVSLENKLKRSPSRRPKSRWEPLPEEKLVEKPASVNHSTLKYSGWAHANERDKKTLAMNTGSKDGNLTVARFSLVEQKGANKITQKPGKRQRLIENFGAAGNGDASSDSDKEQSLTEYYAGAMALANSPEERRRRESRSKRFEKRQGNGAETHHFKSKSAVSRHLYSKRATAMVLNNNFEDDGSRAVEDIDWDSFTVKGTCQEIEKRYLRLTSAPDPATVRPEEVLEKALLMVQNSQKNYLYKCDQLKSVRQDLTVQRIQNQLTVKVYETHARLALEVGDLPEYNQCQSQLQSLYAEGIEGCHMEFAAYNLLCVILHSSNNRDLVSSMSRLSSEAKRDNAVRHALAVRAAVTSGNYVMFFRLFKTAPNLNTCLMDLYVEKMRFKAVSCISRSYRPSLPVSYVAQVLGFSSVASDNDEKDSDGLEECIEWLKAHGACLIADNNGEMQLDAKSSTSSLFMPEPDDAVAHGDASLAVNDFLTRTAL